MPDTPIVACYIGKDGTVLDKRLIHLANGDHTPATAIPDEVLVKVRDALRMADTQSNGDPDGDAYAEISWKALDALKAALSLLEHKP